MDSGSRSPSQRMSLGNSKPSPTPTHYSTGKMRAPRRLESFPRVLHLQPSFHLGTETLPSLSQQSRKSPISQVFLPSRSEPQRCLALWGRTTHTARPRPALGRVERAARAQVTGQSTEARGTLLPGSAWALRGAWLEAALRSGPSWSPWVTSTTIPLLQASVASPAESRGSRR